MSPFRRRRRDPEQQHRANRLDAAITGLQRGNEPDGDTVWRELEAAASLARHASDQAPAPHEPLVALRAALAARRARGEHPVVRRLAAGARLAPAMALAALVGLVTAGVIGADGVPGDRPPVQVQLTVRQYLDLADQNVDAVRAAIEAGDTLRALEAAEAAKAAAVGAQVLAKQLPPGNPVRTEALDESRDLLSELDELVGSPVVVTTTTTTGPSTTTTVPGTTTTTAPGSTTTTVAPTTTSTQPPVTTTTAPPVTTSTTPAPSDDPGTGTT